MICCFFFLLVWPYDFLPHPSQFWFIILQARACFTFRVVSTCRCYAMNRRRFEVCNALTGEVIDMSHISMKIYEHSTVEWLFRYVAERLSWPPSYVHLMAGDVVVEYRRRISDRTKTFMSNLDPASTVLTIQAIKLPRPEYFDEYFDGCLCDFGGCCWPSSGPERFGCRGCGKNACCFSGNCGHECCERYNGLDFGDWDHGFTDMCQLCTVRM